MLAGTRWHGASRKICYLHTIFRFAVAVGCDIDTNRACTLDEAARHIAGTPGYEALSSDDVSGDGIVDVWDCTYLARAIAGIPGYSV